MTLAVGTHTRVPRTYRGRDIMFWMDAVGVLNEPASQRVNLEAARSEPSLHLMGSPDHRAIDLGTVQKMGVRLVGRAAGAVGNVVQFADDLDETMGVADARLRRLLRKIDRYIEAEDLGFSVPAAETIPAIPVPENPDRDRSEGGEDRVRFVGRRVTPGAIPGSTFRCSTIAGRFAMTGGSPRNRVCT